MERVLFIGVGSMGEPMASRLTHGGYKLAVNDASEGRARNVADAIGAQVVVDPVAAARAADVVILMLPSSEIVEGLLLSAGLLDAARPGTLIVDMGSSQPSSTKRLAAAASNRGLQFVDAPVSGGRARALTGELTIMTGGEDAAKLRVHPVLSQMGSSIVDTGEAGTGHAMKALNNLLSATGLLAACEVLVAGAKFGLQPQVMLEVLNNSTGRNHATEVKMAQFVLSRSFDDGFSLDLMVKDLRAAVELVEDFVPEPSTTRATAAGWIEAQQYLHNPAADHTSIARWVESRSGLQLGI